MKKHSPIEWKFPFNSIVNKCFFPVLFLYRQTMVVCLNCRYTNVRFIGTLNRSFVSVGISKEIFGVSETCWQKKRHLSLHRRISVWVETMKNLSTRPESLSELILTGQRKAVLRLCVRWETNVGLNDRVSPCGEKTKCVAWLIGVSNQRSVERQLEFIFVS